MNHFSPPKRALSWLLPLVAGCTIAPQPAELVLTGGQVWSAVEGATPASAIAIRAGRVLHVGTDEEVRRFLGPGTRQIDLAGRLVVPGFIDNHTHFLDGGFQLGSVDLRAAHSREEFIRRLATYAHTQPPNRWIMGGDWDHEAWPGGRLPRREWIDSVTRSNPVSVNRLDGHMVLANTKALELAGITRETKDPPGGTIVHDPMTGEPTGVLKDAAMALLDRVIPAPTPAQLDEYFERAQSHALAAGVTMINDMGAWSSLETYRRARDAGKLKMRVYSLVPLESWARLRTLIDHDGSGNARLRWSGLKGFVDGSLGSTTAWFQQPFADAPNNSGLIVTDTGRLRAWIRSADSAGLQVAVHAIGDRANDWLLDTFEWVAQQNGPRDRRFRVEHAQHLTTTAIPRFAALGVIPSMQPFHAIDDGRWAEKRIGPRRIKTTYAFRSLLDAGARLTFGSDWTVAPIDPLLGIYAAVTRRTIDNRNPAGWVPQQKINVEEALRSYTASNAYASFRDTDLGTLEPGKRGDLVVLSENILRIDPERIPQARIDFTIIEGDIVYERSEPLHRERAAR
jgi:predicted amidohydrolase YtcJ